MPLDSLLSLVEKLRERIRYHGPALRQSEALTRYALIDPLLRELGWDTGNPDLVIPEYKVGGGRADYALLSDGKPTMMVEAKSLESTLQDALSQGIGYCLEQGTPYFSVTDGRRWEIYETHKPVPIAEKRIVQFDLKDGSAAEECLKTLALWRPNVDSGRIAPGQAPVVVPTPNRSAQPESSIPNTQPTPPGPDEHEWQTIAGVDLQGSRLRTPVEIRFPDNSGRPLTTWRSLSVAIAHWLVGGNHLKTSHCPITSRTNGRRTRYAVSTEPVHADGKPFARPVQEGPLYFETHYNGRTVVAVFRTIIKRAGQDPAQFKVRFS